MEPNAVNSAGTSSTLARTSARPATNSNDMTVNHATTVSIGLAITMLGAATSFGVMWQKVNDLDARMARVESKLDRALELKLATDSAGSTRP